MSQAQSEVGLFGLTAAQSFWLLLLVHFGLISAEVYMAWRAGWIKW